MDLGAAEEDQREGNMSPLSLFPLLKVMNLLPLLNIFEGDQGAQHSHWGARVSAFSGTPQASSEWLPRVNHQLRADQSYSRLSRYDETDLIWLLNGREVTALTADTAAIRSPSGSITVYRKNSKPAFGPLGDSLDDFE